MSVGICKDHSYNSLLHILLKNLSVYIIDLSVTKCKKMTMI